MRLYDHHGDPIAAEDVLDGDELRDYYAHQADQMRARVARSRRPAWPVPARDPFEDEWRAMDEEAS